MSNTATPLWPIIDAINEELLAGEPHNISDDGRGYTGYDPQAVYDAINKHLGPENWRYEVLEICDLGNKAIEAKVAISIRTPAGEWLTKGLQFGGGRGDRDLTDGKKAAITDAIKKGFSSWSIGHRAYLGLLEEVKKTGTAAKIEAERKRAAAQQQRQAANPPPPPKTTPPADNPAAPAAGADANTMAEVNGLAKQVFSRKDDFIIWCTNLVGVGPAELRTEQRAIVMKALRSKAAEAAAKENADA